MSVDGVFLILLLPLAAGALNILVGMRLPRAFSSWLAVGGVAASAVATAVLWPLSAGEGVRATLGVWFESAGFSASFGVLFDPLSAAMALMVTVVSTLIHLYAVGYMKREEDPARFFALLNLFVFAMLCVVLADNLLLLFLGWEGVGFCSYALIGFWYRDPKNAAAGRKAFLVTRVGDVFLAVAVLWLFTLLGTTGIPEINAQASRLPVEVVTALVLLLLGGAVGKSAQLPLMTWLPDAMAGPTPVSALIHAATMVTAGVYLLCRLFPLVQLSDAGMAVIATVGAATALYAATCALAQREIKRVLAYSTMSQVGFMFLAVGFGSVTGAMFHLLTHALFKAALFMGAGCIIHLASGENDIFKMGGMHRRSPLVFWTFLAGAACLAGVPFTGGFFSKDAILLAGLSDGAALSAALVGVAALTALLTATYTFRLVILVFLGKEHAPAHTHALPAIMRWTLPPLAASALVAEAMNLPPLLGGSERLDHWLHAGRFAGEALPPPSLTLELTLAATTAVLVALGWWLAHRRYARLEGGPGPGRFLLQGWNADGLVSWLLVRPFGALARFFWKGIDGAVIDGGLDGVARGIWAGGERFRLLSNGRVSSYLTAMVLGLAAVLVYFLARWSLTG